MGNTSKNKKRLFISWSGENSKQIARGLKTVLEESFFNNTDLECFVSDVDISAGDDWSRKIKNELHNCKLGIVCITKENLRAPWIYFESGAIISHKIKLIPLLISCDYKSLQNTPLAYQNMVNLYDQEKFIQMIILINKELKLSNISKENLRKLVKIQYDMMIADWVVPLKALKAMRLFNEKYIYPRSVSTVSIDSLYICTPMASISKERYDRNRDFLISLIPHLKGIGFKKIVCPIVEKPDYKEFDGAKKAIIENFIELKQVDSMLVLYPQSIPSSVLIEIGYGLALCKKTVIFYRNNLPYILKDAGSSVSHLETRQYRSFEDIKQIIEKNGKRLFEPTEGD